MGVCCSKRKHDDISDSNNNKDDEVEEDISAINKNSKLHTEAENSTKETNPTARSSSTVADIKANLHLLIKANLKMEMLMLNIIMLQVQISN